MFYVILFSFFLLLLFLLWNMWKFRNPYKLYLVFGPKGSGKTTLITKLSFKYRKKGMKVYSSVWVPGVYYFNTDDMGSIRFEPNSVIFCDEAGIVFDNRDFKTFSKNKRDFFKYQRQYRIIIYLFSQAFDVDKKIRDLTDYLYILKIWFNCLSVALRIRKAPKVVQSQTDGSDTIGEKLEFSSVLSWPFGGAIFTWVPHWVKFFKSFDPPALPEGDFTYVEAVENVTILSRLVSYVVGPRGSCADPAEGGALAASDDSAACGDVEGAAEEASGRSSGETVPAGGSPGFSGGPPGGR